MITDVLKKWEAFDYDAFFSQITAEEIERIISQDSLSDKNLLALLSEKVDIHLEAVAHRAQEITVRQFGRTVNIYTPLYLSDYCTNHCLYCGFNSRQNIERKKLTINEVLDEGKAISRSGLKHILLLTGGDRENTPLSYIAEAVSILKPLFSSISIEVYGMTTKEYRELMSCGVDHVTIYQETYDKTLYKKLHIAGEKSDYDFRIGAPERAAEAGAHSVNLGVLLGLGDPVIDFFKAALHCNYIRKKYPATSVAMSYPRIRPTAGGFQPSRPISDKELVRFIMAFRLYLPRGEISISTRESASLRDNVLPLGVTKMSADSRTSVGGRATEKSGNEQFVINDRRSVKQLDKDLRLAGFQPVYQDWVRA